MDADEIHHTPLQHAVILAYDTEASVNTPHDGTSKGFQVWKARVQALTEHTALWTGIAQATAASGKADWTIEELINGRREEWT